MLNLRTQYTEQELRDKLQTSPNFVEDVLSTLFRQQTPDEQELGETIYLNEVGFSKADARWLTKLAEHLYVYGHLSTRQYDIAMDRLPKYAKQVERLAETKRAELGIIPVARALRRDPQDDIKDLFG